LFTSGAEVRDIMGHYGPPKKHEEMGDTVEMIQEHCPRLAN
jgi:hypothetical protein